MDANQMRSWSSDEIREISDADDLHVSPFRDDGVTYGTPTRVWSAVVDGSLYARGYNGQNSRWYKAAVKQRRGRITIARMTKEVDFEAVDGPVSVDIDDAYKSKYRGSSYLTPMIGSGARSATVRITPSKN